MPIIDFQFDTGSVPISRIVDAMCVQYNYQAVLANSTPNPETKVQFARRMVKEYIVNIVKSQDTNLAITTATSTIKPITLN